MAFSVFGGSPPPLPMATTPPRPVTASSYGFTFMLSDLNGRADLRPPPAPLLRDLTGRSGSTTALCAHCWRDPAAVDCEACGPLCGVCVRTRPSHRDHESQSSEIMTGARHIEVQRLPPTSFCNACQRRPLTLPYYHCLVCPDYDLCDACDALQDSLLARGDLKLHDPTHAMAKIRVAPARAGPPAPAPSGSFGGSATKGSFSF